MSMHCRANKNAHVKWAFSIEWHSLRDWLESLLSDSRVCDPSELSLLRPKLWRVLSNGVRLLSRNAQIKKGPCYGPLDLGQIEIVRPAESQEVNFR